VLVAIFTGFATGWFAGWIAGKRGKLIAALSNFFLLVAVIGMSIAVNRDLIGNSHFAAQPAIWTWIGLLPAILAGHFAVMAPPWHLN
jgi:hypothetical protein